MRIKAIKSTREIKLQLIKAAARKEHIKSAHTSIEGTYSIMCRLYIKKSDIKR